MTTSRHHAPRVTAEHWDELHTLVDAEARALTLYASSTTADVGDIDDVRAAVLDPMRPATDLSDDRYNAPDPWSTPGAFQSVLAVSRNKRGTVKRARRAGRAPIRTGAVDRTVTGAPATFGRIPAMIAADAIARCRTLADGLYDGAALAAVTDAIYGDDVPTLIGTETFSWGAVVPVDPDDVRAYAESHVGLSGGISRRLDRAVGREYRTADDDPRTWPTGWGNGATSVTWPTRRRLRSLRLRRGEVRERVTGNVTNLVAPGDCTWDPELRRYVTDRAFIGHRAYRRPTSTRGHRARTSARVASATTNVKLDASAELAAAIAPALDTLTPGKRIAWTWRDHAGTATMSAGGRVNIRGAGAIVRSARTPRAAVRAIRLQTAAAAAK